MAEIKENNSLMKKTKAQLVEIILRKDDVEKALRDELKDKTKELDNVTTDYQDMCDEYATSCGENHNLKANIDELKMIFQKRLDKVKIINFGLIIAVVILLFSVFVR
jgi:hypothetical protein